MADKYRMIMELTLITLNTKSKPVRRKKMMKHSKAQIMGHSTQVDKSTIQVIMTLKIKKILGQM